MTGEEELAERLRERVRRLLPEVLANSAQGELRLQAAERLLPEVLHDAATAGFRPRVDLDLSDAGDVQMSVWYAPGQLGGGTSGSRPADPGGHAEVLAWIADEVQEATMEGDQIRCLVWPVCAVHGLGGHAVVAEERAVWWCNGDAGHVITQIGALDQLTV